VLAKLFSDHTDFWKGNRLTVSTNLRRKLALFPIHDPAFAHLGASPVAQTTLYYHLGTHLNKGRRRTSRLVKFEVTEFEEKDAPTNASRFRAAA
jgi:hypothetical protein